MDPMAIAGMIFVLVLVLFIGGFIVLSPITRRLGLLLESRLQKEKLEGPSSEELKELQQVIQGLEAEIRRLSDRQDFTEKLLSSRAISSLPPAGRSEPPA
jgi:hypothetical protein